MGKTEIIVSCNDQALKITDAPVLAAGGLNEVRVVFNFCEKWVGFAKTAIFYRDEEEGYYAVLDENDTCIVPWEVCYEEGTFYFGVFGERNNARRTSNVVRCKVKKGAITSDMMPSDPTPDVYDQIMTEIAEMRAENNTFVEHIENTLDEAMKHNVASIEKTGTNGLVDTYTITFLDGSTQTYTVTNGEKGDKGDPQDAVCYTKQDLTDEQKEQARKNIGAVDPEVFRLVSEETSENWNDIQSMRTEMTDMVSTYTQRFDEKQKAQARENIGATTIDDSSIGSDTWSSKNTVDRLCPDIAESGAVVTCEPVAGYPLLVFTTLPADGCTGLTLRHFGENLLNHTVTNQTINGITFAVGDDGSIIANGTATADVFLAIGKVQLTKGKTYILAGCPDGGNYSSRYAVYTTNNSKYYYDVGDGVSITAEATQNNTFRILVKEGRTVSNLVFRPVVYETETSETYSVNFGTTVNGGSYDWNAGWLTDADGNLTKFTPQTINAFDGVNTLWTDVGDMFVLGKANPVAEINKLKNAILALGGNV